MNALYYTLIKSVWLSVVDNVMSMWCVSIIYKIDNILIIDDAELNVLRHLCHIIDEMFGCVILHCWTTFGCCVKPDRLLRKPQQTCRLQVQGLDGYQQSPAQRSADAELHAFLSLLVALATVYLLPSPTHYRLMVFCYDHELGRILVLPLVGYQSMFAAGTECMQV